MVYTLYFLALSTVVEKNISHDNIPLCLKRAIAFTKMEIMENYFIKKIRQHLISFNEIDELYRTDRVCMEAFKHDIFTLSYLKEQILLSW